MTTAAKKKKTVLVLLILGGLVGVCLIGALAAIAVPNFLKYRYKSKQAEAKYMLKILLTKEQEFRTARGQWALTSRELVEFVNSAPRSSTCFLGAGQGWGGKDKQVKLEQLPASTRERLGTNTATGTDFVIACAVNLDEDEAVDTWIISVSDPNPRIDFADLGE